MGKRHSGFSYSIYHHPPVPHIGQPCWKAAATGWRARACHGLHGVWPHPTRRTAWERGRVDTQARRARMGTGMGMGQARCPARVLPLPPLRREEAGHSLPHSNPPPRGCPPPAAPPASCILYPFSFSLSLGKDSVTDTFTAHGPIHGCPVLPVIRKWLLVNQHVFMEHLLYAGPQGLGCWSLSAHLNTGYNVIRRGN